ncbi:hypothetical protein AB0K18_06725 [Nonomuraea sp. NPDC049421]|uniref:hypothetical protein n=1 Tax=Nonomuraea sp. NPDC049421 TaxID=3155275 RepID=UPI00343C244F
MGKKIGETEIDRIPGIERDTPRRSGQEQPIRRQADRRLPGSERTVLLLDVLAHDRQRCTAHGPGEGGARPRFAGPVVVARRRGEPA